MFPKFALVVIDIVSALAKVLRPSSTPLRRQLSIAAQEDNVSALPRDIDGLLNRDPDIGCMQGRRVVDTVAGYPTECRFLQGADDPLLLLRIDFNKKVGAGRGAITPHP